VVVASWVTVLSVLVGCANAFLLERTDFRARKALSLLMLAPLVIPGVILGISILALPAGWPIRRRPGGWSWSFCAPACRWWCWASSPTSCRLPR
jgi:ABC-type spermidine/putrescine transport system permease subunit II